MARVWLSALATVGVASALAVVGCGDGERLDVGPLGSGGLFASGGGSFAGEGGTHAGAAAGEAGNYDHAGQGSGASGGSVSSGGSSASGGRGGSSTRGGAGGGANGGNTEAGGSDAGGSETGGSAANGGVGGEAGGDGGPAGSGGTGGSSDPTQLAVCVRVDDPTSLSFDTTVAFESAVITDCRINWVTSLYYNSSTGLNDRSDFLNQLLHFNLDLWGCTGRSAPTSFDLIYAPAPLSLADVGALIDAYVVVATTELTLSPGEITDLRALLEHLSEPLLLDPDPGDFSASSCVELGGAGGEGGTG